MKILVIGKNGQLGKSINKIVCKRQDAENFVFIGRKQLDLFNVNSIRNYFRKNKFNLIGDRNCSEFFMIIYQVQSFFLHQLYF